MVLRHLLLPVGFEVLNYKFLQREQMVVQWHKRLTYRIHPPFYGIFITDYFSDPGRAIGLVCVFVCPNNNLFELCNS